MTDFGIGSLVIIIYIEHYFLPIAYVIFILTQRLVPVNRVRLGAGVTHQNTGVSHLTTGGYTSRPNMDQETSRVTPYMDVRNKKGGGGVMPLYGKWVRLIWGRHNATGF